MATFTPGQEEHNEKLRKLCRICAGFLKKFSDSYEPGQNPVVEAEPLNPIPGPAGDPPIAVTLEEAMEEAMEDLRQGKITPEVEKMGTLFVKSKLKTSADGKTALLKTRGKVLFNQQC